MAVNFFPEDSGSGGSGGGGTGNYVPLTQKGTANGVATLDASAKVPSSQLPDISITNTFVVATEVEMLALNAQTGDIAVRTDVNKTFILKTSPASVVGNWVELPTPTNGVFSVDGKTGAVTLTNTYQAKSNELTALSALTDTPGFIKKVGDGVYAVDTTAYLSTVDASIFYQPLNANLTSISGVTGTYGFLVKTLQGWELNTSGYQHASPLLTGIANLTGNGYLEKVGTGWVLNPGPFQPLDINLTGISAIAADGFLTRTNGVWAMDSNRYQYADNELSGFSALPDEVGLVKKTGDGTYVLDKSAYLTGSSSIAMTGDVTGTGTNSNIATTLASITTGKTSTKVTFNNKGLVISGTTLSDVDLPAHSHTVTLTGDVTGSGSNSSITTALPTITSANTATKITYTAKGLVTGGTTLSDTDLPPHPHTVTVTGDITGTGLNSALTLTLPNIATAGTYPKVSVNAKGQVTSGSALLASDIPGLDWAKITTGKPNTLAGYGITDALTIAGTGLTATGNTINAVGTTGRIVANANSIDLATTGTAGVYTKVTTDDYGRVTSGTVLSETDIPGLDASKITSGTLANERLAGSYTGLNHVTGSGFSTFALYMAQGSPDKGIAFATVVNSVSQNRWFLFANEAETGGNTGGDFFIRRYFDDGSHTLAVIIYRSSGNVSIGATTASTSTTTGAVVVAGGVGCQGTINANLLNGLIQLKTYATATRPVASADTVGQMWLNTSTGKIEYVATSSTIQTITSA